MQRTARFHTRHIVERTQSASTAQKPPFGGKKHKESKNQENLKAQLRWICFKSRGKIKYGITLSLGACASVYATLLPACTCEQRERLERCQVRKYTLCKSRYTALMPQTCSVYIFVNHQEGDKDLKQHSPSMSLLRNSLSN